MRVDFEFYATFRDAADQRRSTREGTEGATVGEALSAGDAVDATSGAVDGGGDRRDRGHGQSDPRPAGGGRA